MEGYAKIPNLAIKTLKGKELNLYCKIVAMAYYNGYCNMSQDAFREQIPISKPKLTTVTRSLEEKGWILTTCKKNCPKHYYPLNPDGTFMFRVKSKDSISQLFKKYGNDLIMKEGSIFVSNPKNVSGYKNDDSVSGYIFCDHSSGYKNDDSNLF